MHAHNRYMNLIAIVIAAACLSLTTACGNVAAPTHEVTAVPTQKATGTPNPATPAPQVGCTHETPELRSVLNTTEDEYWTGRPGAWRSRAVRDKYEDLFWRQPNVYDVSISQLGDGKGGWTDTWGITVWVTEKVDQNTLPLEDRIPATLKGSDWEGDVPIQIVEMEPPPKVLESNCDYSHCVANLREGEEASTAEMLKVRDKYEPLFWRQPNVYTTGVGNFTDEHGEWTDTWGIIVRVTKKVDQSTLPSKDRIPDCLEGVPVHIEEEDPPITSQ